MKSKISSTFKSTVIVPETAATATITTPTSSIETTSTDSNSANNNEHVPVATATATLTATRKHWKGMRCSCAHKIGICQEPLDASYHHNDDCRWLCCDELWHKSVCTSASSPSSGDLISSSPGRLKFVGEKKGHVSTARLRRYFVVEHGELKYFAEGLLTPPYGKDLKGYEIRIELLSRY